MQQSTPAAPPAANLLEVIALDVADALAAVRGGADRLELVQEMDWDGLTPSVEHFEAIRAAVDVPLRVMLRASGGFTISEHELDELCAHASRLRAAGMDESILGFLSIGGDVDVSSLEAVLEAAQPAHWTLHRAFDFAADPMLAWKAVANIPGIDAVLTAGSSSGLDVDGLAARLAWDDETPPWVVGGGLRERHVASLRELGITRFHVGSRVRIGARWDRPVDAHAVAQWRALIDE